MVYRNLPGFSYTTKMAKYNFSCTNFLKNFPPKNTTFGVLTNPIIYIIIKFQYYQSEAVSKTYIDNE